MSSRSKKFKAKSGKVMRWVKRTYLSARKKRRQQQRKSRQINRRRNKNK